MKKYIMLVLALVILALGLKMLQGKSVNGTSHYNGALIYEGDSLLDAKGIKIHKVSEILNTPNTLIVEVHYSYNNPTPAEKVRVRVVPDMPYAKVKAGHVAQGEDLATQVTINVHNSSMVNKGIQSIDSQILQISFDEYDNNGLVSNTIYQTPIIYAKTWKPKKG